MIDSFQDYQDIWQDHDDIWHRGPTDDALNGCVLVNPSLSDSVCLVVSPLLAGVVATAEYLKGIFTVKPNE